MTNDQLCLLALQAMTDPDALPAFGDALQETGWIDGEILKLSFVPVVWAGPFRERDLSDDGVEFDWKRHRQIKPSFCQEWPDGFDEARAEPTMDFASAVAATLMFGHWVPGFVRWPLVETCRIPHEWDYDDDVEDYDEWDYDDDVEDYDE